MVAYGRWSESSYIGVLDSKQQVTNTTRIFNKHTQNADTLESVCEV